MLLIFTETFFSMRGIQPGPRDKILVLEALAARGKKAGNMECVRTRVHVRRTPSSCCQSALCRHRCDRSDEAAAADRAPRRRSGSPTGVHISRREVRVSGITKGLPGGQRVT